MNVSILKSKLCVRFIPRFDEDCKNAQMRAIKLKKIWKKEDINHSWEVFKLAQAKKGRVIVKLKKKIYCESRAKAYNSLKELWKTVREAKNRVQKQSYFLSI